MLKGMLVAFGLVLLCQPCFAAEWSGYRTVKTFGCHKGDGTCYVDIGGLAVTGASGCTSNSVRWDAQKDTNGKSWLALVMLAKSLNKKIGFYVNGCYASQPAFPTFAYGFIEE